MHFTRDPIIETIISARDGHKILIRDIHHVHDEYYVDMIEVVRIGEGCFYRSQEKPKPFLVPAGHYEIIEVREPRMALKTSLSVDKGVKISAQKEIVKEKEEVAAKPEKKRERKRTRKKKEKSDDLRADESVASEEESVEVPVQKIGIVEERRTLIPPPPTLISETISRYKNTSAIEELALEENVDVQEEENAEEAIEIENEEFQP